MLPHGLPKTAWLRVSEICGSSQFVRRCTCPHTCALSLCSECW